jgi:uncharacterized sulfatase
MEILYQQGKLTPQQAQFMAPTRPEEELYDLQSDPHELHNLADEPESQEILPKLRQKLAKWIEEAGDQGETPEDKEVVTYWDNFFEQNYADRMTTLGLSVDAPPEDLLDWWEGELARMRA